jgi:hypothetical protein
VLDAGRIARAERLARLGHERETALPQLVVDAGWPPALYLRGLWGWTVPSVDHQVDLLGAGRPVPEQGVEVAEEEGMVAGDDADAARQTPDAAFREQKTPGITW